MIVSDKLANEIHTIIMFHMIAITLLFCFTFYLYLKAKKTPLLYSFLSVVALILIWMFAKIFKTVSYNIELRWFFVVLQYFAVEFLGFSFLIFSFYYKKYRFPSKKVIILLLIIPFLSFFIIATNPFHHLFYSYFGFYRDSFGFMFYIIQGLQYIYLISGIFILSFCKIPHVKATRKTAKIFTSVTVFSLFFNIYYILFKLDVFEWIFPFMVFDITPIAISFSLILFMLPNISNRFFDVSPFTYHQIYNNLPHPVFFLDSYGVILSPNKQFYTLSSSYKESNTNKLIDFINLLPINSPSVSYELYLFLTDTSEYLLDFFELRLKDQKTFHIYKNKQGKNLSCIYFYDVTILIETKKNLLESKKFLEETYQKVIELNKNVYEIALSNAKSITAQNVHDILGHSLTLVIASLDLSADDKRLDVSKNRLLNIKDILNKRLTNLKSSIENFNNNESKSSLIDKIKSLNCEAIEVNFHTQGLLSELSEEIDTAFLLLCKESITNSIKHGFATKIDIILRYNLDTVELFTINNGLGIKHFDKHLGLLGIEERVKKVDGLVNFSAGEDIGFTIHAIIPK